MKRNILVIGIGAGNPDFLTLQAIKAINRTDVFFIPIKGEEKEELARVRREMISSHARERPFRMVEYDTPKRRSGEDGYQASVSDWHDRVEAVFAKLVKEELDASETGAFLIWGDPALYDSTIRIIERLSAEGSVELDYEVIPGISAVQALAARHKVALNSIGRPVLISTGRSTKDVFPEDVDSVVVMLNAEKSLRAAGGEVEIYWGAYLGMPDEVLVSGKLCEVLDDIERIREEARKKKGWIMDSVLLRKPPQKT